VLFGPPLTSPLIASAPSGNGRLNAPRFRHAFAAHDLVPEAKPVPVPKETLLKRAARFQAMLDTG